MSDKYGDQFNSSRFNLGKQNESDVSDRLENIFESRNVVSVEPDETYDNYKDQKKIHQLIDYTGIDYLVDPFDAPVFGVNHRTHTPTDAELRLDLRKDTGTSSPSELDKLIHASRFDIVPKYASRLKQSDDGVDWFRVVDLEGLIDKISDGLEPHKTWTDGDVVAWMYNYDYLEENGLLISSETTRATDTKITNW